MLRATLFCVVMAAAGITQAAVVRFDGRDAVAGPGDPRPNADAARSAFLSAVGGSPFALTFEGVPIGYAPLLNFTTFTFTQVGTADTIFGGNDTGVTKDTQEATTLGYNTTPSGDTVLRFTPIFDVGTAGATLNFTQPIEYFGAFITGLGSAAGTLNAKFNNGSSQVLPVTGGPGGGVQFFGFTTFGAPFTSLDLVLDDVFGSRDIYSIDDVITGLQPTFQPGNTVPEPSSLALSMGVLAAAGALRRRSPRSKV